MLVGRRGKQNHYGYLEPVVYLHSYGASEVVKNSILFPCMHKKKISCAHKIISLCA